MEELLQRALDGDGVAEEELFSTLRVRFLLLAKRRLGERDAEDVTQDACVTVAQKYRTLDPGTTFAAWAFQVLRYKIGNRLQGRARDREVESAGWIESALDDSTVELEREIVNCLHRIYQVNRNYARVLNLVHLGFDSEEICRILKITKGNLYVLLNRSRKQLRKCLQE